MIDETKADFQEVLRHPLLEPLTLALHKTRPSNDVEEFHMDVARDRAFRILYQLIGKGLL